MTQVGRENALLLSASNTYATIKSTNDGGSQTISFTAQEDQQYRLTYLTIEGVFVHAQMSPNALCLRIPTLQDSSKYVDVSYQRAATIVEWLAKTLYHVLQSNGIKPGSGVVVTLLTLPYAHSFFHTLALFQLGCAVQYFNHELGQEAMDTLLGQPKGAKSSALMFAGLTVKEYQTLNIATIKQRIGVQPIEIEEEHFAIRLIENVPHTKPREPQTEETFNSHVSDEQILAVIHTSGSTGIPKLVYYDIFAFSLLVKLPPQAEKDIEGLLSPFLNASRAYWASSLLLMIQSIINGCPIALCYPEDRLYPSIKETICAVAATKSMGVFLYASQITELHHILECKKYRSLAARSLKLVIFAGAGVDQQNSDLLSSITLPIRFGNLHGMSEVGSTGLICIQAPYNCFQSVAPYQLWEPMESYSAPQEENKPTPRLVKLWICLDNHPVAWWFAFRRLTPIKVQRFPVPGPFQNRPALDTGDVFQEVNIGDDARVDLRYTYHSRSDDQIRLSNLYRPNVISLEVLLLQSLRSRLPNDAVDAVQLCGDQKPRLALVIQLHGPLLNEESETRQAIEEAVQDLNAQLPKKVRFHGLKRVKVIILDKNKSSLGPEKLEKTHKGTLRRLYNLSSLSAWHDSLDYDE